MPGTYRFEWVVADRVVSGRSDIPEQDTSSGILFYVREQRATPATLLADDRSMRLRFTRFNVQPDRFESRMEVSFNGGSTWRPGNHQVFTRAGALNMGIAVSPPAARV